MKIRIKTFEELQETEDITEIGFGLKHNNNGFFNYKMKSLCGKMIEVKKINDKRYLYIHEYNKAHKYWCIAEWMIKNNMNRNGANL